MQLNFLESIGNGKMLEYEFFEFENKEHIELTKNILLKALNENEITNNMTREELKDWFVRKYFDLDIEISCLDLYDIAEQLHIRLN